MKTISRLFKEGSVYFDNVHAVTDGMWILECFRKSYLIAIAVNSISVAVVKEAATIDFKYAIQMLTHRRDLFPYPSLIAKHSRTCDLMIKMLDLLPEKGVMTSGSFLNALLLTNDKQHTAIIVDILNACLPLEGQKLLLKEPRTTLKLQIYDIVFGKQNVQFAKTIYMENSIYQKKNW